MPALKRLFPLFWLPGLMYLGYGIARTNGIQGETDLVGISSVMRIVFLSFGGSVAYLLIIAARWDPFRSRLKTALWHNIAAWSLAMVIDDSFMIHEQLGIRLHIADAIPLLLLGAWLLAILVFYRKRLVGTFWKCFAGFVLLSGVAECGDTFAGSEGTVMIRSFEFDYEMVCEVFAVLLLVAGFAIQAATELRAAAQPSSPAGHDAA